MTKDDCIARIEKMEQLMDRCCDACTLLEQALCRYEETEQAMEQLAAYYLDGGPWAMDCEADAAGLLPQNLKRGVLSQDALWNLFVQRRELQQEMLRLSGRTEAESE